MIHSLAIENFTSFHEPTRVEVTVGRKAGRRDIFLPSSLPDVWVNSVTGVFGANASGKTNLLKAIAFLRYFILDSAAAKPEEEIPVECFVFAKKNSGQRPPTRFELEFEYGDRLYRYELSINTKQVLHEALYRKDQRFRYLFEREWNAKRKEYDFKFQDIGPSRQVNLRENASFLSSAVLQEHEFAEYIAEYFKKCYVNVRFSGRMPTHDPETVNIFKATDYYVRHPNCLSAAVKHISAADLGISNVAIEEARFIDSNGNEQMAPFPVTHHSIEGVNYKRALIQESRGTQSLYVLLRYILPVLETGGVAIIDEFETGLHSHVVEYIVKLFYSPVTNPNGAQLIANFHTDFLLQTALEKYQIILTEKDPDTQSTDAWRLDTVKGLARNANNHYAKYHAGAYGAVPNL
jgi:uncharacterized protein